jgi:hypothetical protein
VDRDFNIGAFWNYQDEKDMDKFVEIVSSLDRYEDQYKSYYEQPLLTKEPKLDDAIAFLRSIT